MSIQSELAGNAFLVLGRVGMDLYAGPVGTPIETAGQFSATIGGSSANIAVALARHGAKPSLVTSVSDDAVGRFCLSKLREFGVDCSRVRTIAGEARTSLAVVDTNGEATQAVLYRNGAADLHMTTQDIEDVDIPAFNALVFTGTLLAAEPSRSATLHAIKRAKQMGMKLIIDLDYRPYSWASKEEAAKVTQQVVDLCDVIIGNDDEFGVLAGDHTRGLDKARDTAKTADIVVYKMGSAGAVTFFEGQEIRTGIYPVKALKPTGAGDAFMGGFIASLAAGFPVDQAVLRGSASASIVVSKVGCAPAMPDTAELEAFLATHPGPTKP